MKRTLLILGGLFTFVAIGWTIFTLLTLMGQRTQQWHLRYSSATSVDVGFCAGHVDVMPSAGDQIRVDYKVRWAFGHPRLSAERSGDTQTIKVHCPYAPAGDFSGSMHVALPRGTNVRVRSSGGGVTVTNIDGDLDIASSGGGVHVENAMGNVKLGSSDGGVTATGLQSSTVQAHSSGGGVRLTFVQVPDQVNAGSSDGSVRVTVPGNVAYKVDANSSDGSTHIDVPTDPSSPHTISAHSSGGSVRVTSLPSGGS
jgi:hypothetical protein